MPADALKTAAIGISYGLKVFDCEYFQNICGNVLTLKVLDLHYKLSTKQIKQMHYTIHSIGRLSQRGISHAMAELVYAYGEAQGNKVILNQKMTSARLIEARAERSALLKALDAGSGDLAGDLHLVAALGAEIRNLVKLLDKHETAVVVSGDTLITAYGIH